MTRAEQVKRDNIAESLFKGHKPELGTLEFPAIVICLNGIFS